MKRIAIVQSSYIPWKGYFDLIRSVDEFILYDDAQYTKRDWRNRNKIKTPDGLLWLTIPVQVKGKFDQKVKDTLISDLEWRQNHWKAIVRSYARADYFHDYKELFEELYLGYQENLLSQVNYRFLTAICKILGINTKLSWSMDYQLSGCKTGKLISLCQQTGAGEYLSGPTAKGYIDESFFNRAGIKLTFIDYSGYPEYEQPFPPFEHGVSIIDLIFNKGSNAPKYMKTF